MSVATDSKVNEIRWRPGPSDMTAMEIMTNFTFSFERDLVKMSRYGAEGSFADLIAETILGDEKGEGFAAQGLWAEINGLLLSISGYPIVLNHDLIAKELEAREGAALAQAYRAQIADLTSRMGAQSAPHWVSVRSPFGDLTER